MKFTLNRVLTPEILLGLRGHNESQVVIQEILNTYKEISWETINSIVQHPEKANFLASMIYSYIFNAWNKEQKVFYVGKEFADTLSGVKIDIPNKYIPDEYCAYFAFPENYIEIYSGAFVHCFIPKNAKDSKGREIEKIVAIVFDNKDLQINYCLVNLYKDIKIEDALDTLIQHDSFLSKEDFLKRAKFILNLLCYVCSMEPNLDNLKPERGMSRGEKKQHREKKNYCLLPVTLVNWSYGQQRTYNVASTEVTGHFKWQPCGPQWSLVKLIWIDEYIRNFKNFKDVTKKLQEK